MKAVLAGSYREYLNYLRENNLSNSDAIYIHSLQDIRGKMFDEIITYGTWYINKESDELLDHLETKVRNAHK